MTGARTVLSCPDPRKTLIRQLSPRRSCERVVLWDEALSVNYLEVA